MPRTLTSWVWEHCVRSEDGLEATCKLCNDVFLVKGSTSSLNKHLINVHAFTFEQNEDDSGPPKRRRPDVNGEGEEMVIEIDGSTVESISAAASTSTSRATEGESMDESGELPTRTPSSRPTIPRGRIRSVAAGARPDRPCSRDRTELITQSLTKMIVMDMLPLTFVASIGFRDLMKVVEPNYQVPCRQTIKNRLVFVYEQVSTKIATELSEITAVALTSDCWSSQSQDAYITVTIHFLDSNWVPKTFTLATEELSERHTAANLTTKLMDIMTQWKINGKVPAVVTDNAQNAKNAVKNLDGILINENVTCAAHSLQLCVTKPLKLEEAAVIFEKASRVVTHFRHSNIAATALERKQEQLGIEKLKLIQSCSTRWDSSFAMISRLLCNRSPVTNVLSDRAITTRATAERLEISEREWSAMEHLQRVLKPLQVATTVLCSDSCAPISMVRPIVYTLRDNHLRELAEDDEIIKPVKETLRDELTTRFHLTHVPDIGVNARQVASFLGPRYKDLLVESAEARDSIRSFVRGHFTDDLINETAMDFLFQTTPKQNNTSAQFDLYLTELQISHNLNPFEWWSSREKRYPALANLARMYLCIPSTSASSERTFSTAGNIVNPKRNCLLPENVNLLVFLYQNRILM